MYSCSYTSPYSSTYTSPKSYSSSLPPRYVPPSRYSNISTTSSYLSKLPSSSTASKYTSSYSSSTLPETQSWRSVVNSPSVSRRDYSTSSSTLPRRPSFSSGSNYRSSSVPSVDSYKTSSYSSASTPKDEWTPRTSRQNSISSFTSLPPQSSFYSGSNSTSYPYRSSTAADSSKLAGRVGLQNLGNTCFMNAVLQCLCHTHPLVEYCKRGSFSSDINRKSPTGGDLIKSFASLIGVLWKDNPNNSVSPDSLKRELQKYAPRFAGYNQQDAQELLRFLLQGLHDDINRITTKTSLRSFNDEHMTESQKATESWRRYQSMDDSKIVDIFGGQLKSSLSCTECGNTSVTFDPFWDLSLPIPEDGNRISIHQCFRLFTSPEVLEGSEKPMCERCKKKTKSTKQLEINKFPTILVIHLKRFSSGLNYRNKLNVSVDYSLKSLDLSRFASNCLNSNCLYDLYGVVDHFGSSSSGHYTAKCKNPFTEEWNEFNDNMVVDVSTTNLVTDKAYLLFYEQTKARRNSRF